MWQNKAACQNFFGSELPKKYGDVFHEAGDDLEKQQVALAMCAVCPVRWECLRAGLNPPNIDKNERWIWGIWGEMLEADLRDLVNETEEGKPSNKSVPKKMACPYCKTVGTVETTRVKRTKKHLECTHCGLTWWSKIKLSIIPIENEEEEEPI